MFAGLDGEPDPASRGVVVPNALNPVQLKVGTDGDLFYVNLNDGEIRRVRFDGVDKPPTAVIAADVTSGPLPLMVNFDGTLSSDLNPGDSLTYAWDLDDDGQLDDSTDPQPSFAYTNAGLYTVTLEVTDSTGLKDTDTILISAGNTAPTAVIDQPSTSLTWIVDDLITFSGHADDPDEPGGTLPASQLDWDIVLYHCPGGCHTHFITSFAGTFTESFNAPDHEYPSYLEVKLTATDPVTGLQDTDSVLLFPETVDVTLASSPPGLALTINGTTDVAPFTTSVIVGSNNSISASSPQTVGQTSYQFNSWSDGGSQNRNIVAGSQNETFTAEYVVIPSDTTDSGTGTITAQGENGSSESKEKAFDNNINTKWLDFASANPGTRASWIQYKYAGNQRFVVSSYTITSANDRPERDPKDWSLLGSNDGVNFTVLDTRSNETFPNRLQQRAFIFSNTTGYNIYRLDIASVANPPAANSIQLAELEFIGVPEGEPSLPMVNIVANDPIAAEGTPPDPGQFTITRTGALAGDLDVNYSVGGSTVAGDYSEVLSGTVTIPNGLAAASITITPFDDALEENPESVQISLLSTSNYTIGLQNQDVVTINDNDSPVDPFDTTDAGTGIITAQGEHGPSEGKEKAFDNNLNTKWLDFASANPATRASWIQYQYADGDKFVVTTYTISSANDKPAHDPRDWTLLGSNDGVNFTPLDTRNNEFFSSRFETRAFAFSNSTAYNTYRLDIHSVADPGGANSVQLSEIELIGVPESAANQPPFVASPIGLVTADEDDPDSIIVLSTVFDDPDIPAGDSLTFTVETNTNSALVNASVLGNTVTLDYQDDQNGNATIVVRATDSGGLFVEDTISLTVNAVNDNPVVDLNGGAPGIDFGAAFVEDAGAVLIVDSDLAVKDPDGGIEGSIYVADQTAGVLRIDPFTGNQTSIAAGGLISQVEGIAIAADGSIFVVNHDTFDVIKIDPATGNQTLVATTASGGHALAIEDDGRILMGQHTGISRVDPVTGQYQVLTTALPHAHGLAIEANGDILAVGASTLIRINPITGASTTVSAGNNFDNLYGVVISELGDIFVTDSTDGQVIQVDPTSGVQSVYASAGQLNPGIKGLALDAQGNLLVVDPVDAQLIRVELPTGSQSIVSATQIFDVPMNLAVNPFDSLLSATARITNLLDGADEILSVDAAGTNITPTYNPLNGELSLQGLETTAHYEQVLRTLVYQNVGQDPTPTDRIVQVFVNDGIASSVTAVSTVNVQAVNDPPTSTGNTVVIDEDVAHPFAAADFTFADVDSGDSLTQVQITALPAIGALELSGVAVVPDQIITLAEIVAGNLEFVPLPDGNGSGYDSFNYKVHDGTTFSLSDATMTINVTPVNDPPTSTGNTVVTDEDVAHPFAAADFTFADVDSGDSLTQVQITALPAIGALELSGVAVVPDQIIALAEIVAGNLEFVPLPDGNGSGYDSFNYKVHDGTTFSLSDATMTINVTPVNDPPTSTGNTVVADEDVAHPFAAADFTFADVDSGDSLTQVQITALPAIGALELSGVAVVPDQIIALAEIVAGNLEFVPLPDGNGSGYDSFNYKVHDGTTFSLSDATMTINVTPVNDPPTSTGNTVVIDEDVAHPFAAADFTFADVDSGDSLTQVQITALPAIGALELSGVAVVPDQIITLAEIVAGNLEFVPLPDGNGSGYDSFNYKVHDGTTFSLSDATMTINVTPVNDPPTSTGNTVVTDEDVAHPFAAADFTFADVDSGDSLTQVQITALPAIGALELFGVAVVPDQIITLAEIVAGNLEFVPLPDGNGSGYDSFNYKVHDGTTFSLSDATMTINVTPVNDPPTSTGNTVVTNEDVAHPFAAADFTFADVDSGDSLTQVQITALPAVGALELSGVAVVPDQIIALAEIVAGNLEFVPLPDGNGSGYDSFGYKVHDGTTFSLSDATMTINVTPVNDPPTSTGNTVVTDEDVAHPFAVADFTFADVDSGDSLTQVQITTLPAVGALELSGVAVVPDQIITLAEIVAGNLEFVPLPDGNGSGYDSFNYKVHDGTTFSLSDATMTINVTPVNDPPTSTGNTVVADEDVAHPFAAADFTFADVDSGDSLTQVQITALPAIGALELFGVAVVPDQIITLAEIVAGNLEFVPLPTGTAAATTVSTIRCTTERHSASAMPR